MKKILNSVPEKLRPYLPFVLVAVVLLMLWKFGNKILIGLGFKKAPDQEAYDKQIADNRKDIITGADKSLEELYKTQPATKTDQEFLQIADMIDADLNAEFIDNENDAVYQVCRMKNDSDVFKLIGAYGSRPTMTVFSMGFNSMTLSQTLHNELSKTQIETINANYARKGIKYRF